MDIVFSHVAGLDVHKKSVVVCCITPDDAGRPRSTLRTFRTMTADLLALADWLTSLEITHVAMESTGEFWKPVYNLLEASFTVLVVNAQHIKHVPGRKTDVKDAQWIAQLLQHGLLQGSFIPPQPQRDLRDLTRQRTTLVRERVAVVNRLQKVLEWANIKLAGVASNVVGVSARAMLTAIVQGEDDPTELAALARRRLRLKHDDLVAALEGRVRDHHRFLIAEHLSHIDYLESAIERYDAQITTMVTAQSDKAIPPAAPPDRPSEAMEPAGCAPAAGEPPVDTALDWETAVTLLDTIPGVARPTAEVLVAEIGADMTRFASAGHLARWARVCPGNNESAGKRLSGATGHGNTWLRSTLVQAAHAAARTKGTYLASVYRRLVARRGVKKAIMAVAHRIVIAIYHMLSKREPYHDLGATYHDERSQQRLIQQLQRRVEALGYTVAIVPPTCDVAA
jgi:transposase